MASNSSNCSSPFTFSPFLSPCIKTLLSSLSILWVPPYLKETILDIAKDKEFTIKAMEIGESDHIHLFVSAHPKHSIGQIVKWIKGISGIKLFRKFPELRYSLWKEQLWSHSYYVETIGSTSEENIKRYIENQNIPHSSRR